MTSRTRNDSQGTATMTYQGERARPMVSESTRFFEVSKIRLGSDGHVSDVLWGEVAAVFSTKDRQSIHRPKHRPAHRPERAFVIVLHEDGRECISFDGASSPGRNLIDMTASMADSA
jgi:hypothetical protein